MVENATVTDGSEQRVRLYPGRDPNSSERNIVGHFVEGEARRIVVVKFHNAEAWGGRRHLLDAGYGLETLDGEPIAPNAGRAHQCLARSPGA